MLILHRPGQIFKDFFQLSLRPPSLTIWLSKTPSMVVQKMQQNQQSSDQDVNCRRGEQVWRCRMFGDKHNRFGGDNNLSFKLFGGIQLQRNLNLMLNNQRSIRQPPKLICFRPNRNYVVSDDWRTMKNFIDRLMRNISMIIYVIEN